jgi:hypothetical protein
MPLIAVDVAAAGIAVFFAATIVVAVVAFVVHARLLERSVRQSRLAPRALPTPPATAAQRVTVVPVTRGSAMQPAHAARRRPAAPQKASLALRLSSAERRWARQRRESLDRPESGLVLTGSRHSA